MAHRAMGFSLVETGALADAEAAFQRALEIAPDDGMAQAGLIQVFVRTGRMEAAKRGAAELSRRARAERGFASFASWAHAACGEQDLAFAWIDRAIAERSVFLASLRSFRWWYPLRSDPRFTQVVEQLRIPAKPAASVS